jgi:hypothetical protein
LAEPATRTSTISFTCNKKDLILLAGAVHSLSLRFSSGRGGNG